MSRREYAPPDVSIVVPVFNHWAVTRRCLESLFRSATTSVRRAEILLADDASSDETATAWREFEGRDWQIRYVRHEQNLGFLRTCNATAQLAAGEYLCLLNNDVVVEPGWLDRLVDTIENEPNVGAVGPRFLGPKGTILECGGVVHADGSARQLGWSAKADDSRYTFVNDVDYVSGACLFMRTDLFRELGGFDERYAPAYYEDTDLCMRLAQMGLRVLVNPAARMTHFEGSTHGTSGGLKRYQEINRAKFYERWAGQLRKGHPPASAPEDVVRTSRRLPTVAFYYPRPLTFDMDSGALRVLRLMLELRRRGHHVVLVAMEEGRARLDTLHRAGIETMSASWGGDWRHLQWLANAPPWAAVFCHVASEERFAKSYYEFAPGTIRLFDTVDLQFLREARERRTNTGAAELLLPSMADLDSDDLAELAAGRRSDITLVVSAFERQLLIDSFDWDPTRVCVVSNVHVPDETRRPFAERNGYVFLGGFAHAPNVDAAQWISNSIWPEIRRRQPDATLDIYGSSMPAQIRSLGSPDTGVFVRGYAPDHRVALSSARVMLSPLRFGAGVKGKIGESLAVGTPVVTNAIGAEGMDEAGLALALGESPDELAGAAVRLYSDIAEWERRSATGIELLRDRFSPAANVVALLTAIGDAQAFRVSPSGYELEQQRLWRELGHPGKPYTMRMQMLRWSAVRNIPTLPARLWRFYRTHGARAFGRRVRVEASLRRVGATLAHNKESPRKR